MLRLNGRWTERTPTRWIAARVAASRERVLTRYGYRGRIL